MTALGSSWKNAPHTRKYFYAGGHYADDGTGNHIFKDQVYVEQLTPLNGPTKPHPIVFIHGQAQSGTVCVSPFTHSTTHAMHKLSPS